MTAANPPYIGNIGTNGLPEGFEFSAGWQQCSVTDPTKEWNTQYDRARRMFPDGGEIFEEIVDPMMRHVTIARQAWGFERNDHHQESSVLAHAVDVLYFLRESNDRVLIAAALAHDIGKMVTLETVESDDKTYAFTNAQHHEREGKRILDVAPEIVPDPDIRDDVAYLTENHMRPLWLYRDHGKSDTPSKVIDRAIRKWGEKRHDLLQFSTADIALKPDCREINRFYNRLAGWMLPEDSVN